MSNDSEEKAGHGETSLYRDLVDPYCVGCGLDVGCGGDAVNSRAIRMDLADPYTHVGESSIQLTGTCRELHWFKDGVLDYVYSSHVLEDFPEQDTEPILREWTRVIRPGGKLVLLLPDQKRYIESCKKSSQYNPYNGIYGNENHSIDHFSLAYIQEVAGRISALKRFAEHENVGPYSFIAVFERIQNTDQPLEMSVELRQSRWNELDELRTRVRQQAGQIQEFQRPYFLLRKGYEILTRKRAP